jgi:hypothetical protein
MRFGDTKPSGTFEIQLKDFSLRAGSPVPAIATAQTQTGGRRRTGREVAVSVRNLKAELS